ncbi:MAG TPA: hypothetical protein PK521_04035 [Bacteroidales bacterium]|nr:hypothetical protein [Bacteroidales bacterium]HOX74419.1 hypothetical protein [Bacteroidales bacterium]HQM68453.1 hypothetical protein [Bacteroidales bacterium]
MAPYINQQEENMGAAFTKDKEPEEEQVAKSIKNFQAANSWISDYQGSGYSRVKLSECEKMTLNRVALITKLLIGKPDMPVGNLLEMPDPFFFTWEKTFLVFRNNIGNPAKITEKKEVSIESYLTRIHTLEYIRKLLEIWDPEENDNFTSFILYKKIEGFVREEESRSKKLEKLTRRTIEEFERSLAEPLTERMAGIIYIAILFIRDLPHKILIFLYVSFLYRKQENINWDKFIKKGFSKTLWELYNYICKQKTNKEFDTLFRELYGEVILKTPVSYYYKRKSYDQLLSLTGREKPVGDVVLRTFFHNYYKGKSGKPDLNKIKQVLEKWVSRIKFEAQQVLIDKERFLDLNDIMKIS